MQEVLNKYLEGLTQEQLRAVNSDSKIIGVVASAGSGKTRVLTSRIIRILVEGKADIDEIVAITFTEKASLEMKERLRKAFNFFVENSKNNPEQLTLWRHREIFLETARISTIHSFCARILRQYALRFGLDPEFSIVDDVENIIKLDRFIRDKLKAYLESDEDTVKLATELSTSGFRQILFSLLSNYIFILPHAEKCNSLTEEKFYSYIDENIKNEYESIVKEKLKGITTLVLLSHLRKLDGGITDSQNPLEQKRRYLIKLLEMLRKSPVGGEELRNYIEEIKIFFDEFKGKRVSAGLDEEIKRKFEYAIKKVWGSEKEKRGFLNGIFIDSWEVPNKQKIFSLTRNLLILFSKIVEEWKEFKRKQNILTFDDLIYFCIEFLEGAPEICQEVASDIKYLFVDEFQDTDSLQVKLIDLLMHANPDINLFFVGDAKQSIYLFRGAEVKIFQDEKKKAQELIGLSVNFRSAPEILDFVNDFFSKTNFLFQVEEPYVNMRSHRNGYDSPRVEMLLAKDSNERDDINVERKVEIEAEAIAHRIKEFVDGVEHIEIKDEGENQSRQPKYGDFALLFRTTTHIYKYEKILKDSGIPCRIVCGRGFFDVDEVKEIMTFLQVLINPFNHPALLGFLRGPFCSLSDEQILRWRMHKPLEELLIGTDFPSAVDEECYKEVRQLYNEFRQKLGMPLDELVTEIIARTNYESILIAQDFGEQKLANIQKFISLVRAYSENTALNLFNFNLFLEEVKSQILEGEADIFLSPEDAVMLTTVHKAKGMEFPIVVLPHLFSEARGTSQLKVEFNRELGLIVKTDKGLKKLSSDNGTPPIDNPWAHVIKLKNEVEDEHEYVRLLYVALTRAKDYLILCAPDYPSEKIANSWFNLLTSHFSFRQEGTNLYRVLKKDIASIKKAEQSRTKEEVAPYNSKLLVPVKLSIKDFSSTDPIPVSQLLNLAFGNYDHPPAIFDRDLVYDEYLVEETNVERGVAVHYLMRKWDFDSDSVESDLLNNFISDENLISEVKSFMNCLTRKNFYSLLKQNPPIERELPFIWKVEELDGVLIKGIVDAILQNGTIVDYKTGEPNNDVLKRYWQQLKIYYFALSNSKIPIKDEVVLIFLDKDEIFKKKISQDEREEVIIWLREVIERYFCR